MRATWHQIQSHLAVADSGEAAGRPSGRDIWGNSFAHRGKFYIFGGAWNRFEPGDKPELDRLGVANDLWCFDPVTGTWQLLEPDQGPSNDRAPARRPGGRLISSLVTVGDDAFLFGGLTLLERGFVGRALNDLWRYHIPTGHWELIHPDTGWSNFVNKPSHPPIRMGASAVVIGTRLYVFGGSPFTVPTFTVNDLWCYDTQIRKWEQISGWRGPQHGAGYAANASYPGPRYCANLFSLGDALFLFSGRDLDKTGGRDVVLGNGGPEWFNDLWRYDLTHDEWTLLHPTEETTNPVLGACYPTARYGSGHAVVEDSFYLFGGYSSQGGSGDRNDLWRYQMTRDHWEMLHPDDKCQQYGPGLDYPSVRRVPAMAPIEGSLILFGGLNYSLGPADRGFWAHPGGAIRRPHPTPLNDLWRCDLDKG